MVNDPKTENHKACSSAICRMADDIIEAATKEKDVVKAVTSEGHGIFTEDIVRRYTGKEQQIEEER